MSPTLRILIQSEIFASLRNKWFIIYSFSFFAFFLLISMQSGTQIMQTAISLLNVMLLLIPLFSLLFGTLSFSESISYTELILIHGVSRFEFITGKFIGLGTSLSLAFLLGTSAGLVFFLTSTENLSFIFLLLSLGFLLNYIYLGVALVISSILERKEMILAVALIVWFYTYLLYDFIVMFIAIVFRDYPLEVPILLLTFLNPLDLVRVILLLSINLASSMSLGAAMIEKTLSGLQGVIAAFLMLCLWIVFTWQLAARIFAKKDL